jgi:DNA-binding response OmpR family regulator
MDAIERYRFGPFELQPDNRRLLKDGATISLRPRAFDLLAALVERAGRLVTKDELLGRVWPKTVIEEAALHVQVSAVPEDEQKRSQRRRGDLRRGLGFTLRDTGKGSSLVACATPARVAS